MPSEPEASRDDPAAREPGRLRAWAGRYRAPLTMSAFFAGLLLVLSAITLTRPDAAQISEPVATATPRPARGLCGTCDGICDPANGRCTPRVTEPPDCVEGSHFDDEQGFCIPDATPRPTRAPVATLSPERTIRPQQTPPGSFQWFFTPQPAPQDP